MLQTIEKGSWDMVFVTGGFFYSLTICLRLPSEANIFLSNSKGPSYLSSSRYPSVILCEKVMKVSRRDPKTHGPPKGPPIKTTPTRNKGLTKGLLDTIVP